MSLHPQATYPIPEATQRVARAAFPHGNLYIQVADRLGNIAHDAPFSALFPRAANPRKRRPPGPGHLPPVCRRPFRSPSRGAVRSRIDWKYVLGLELTDPGFHHTVLSEFRTRLVTGGG